MMKWRTRRVWVGALAVVCMAAVWVSVYGVRHAADRRDAGPRAGSRETALRAPATPSAPTAQVQDCPAGTVPSVVREAALSAPLQERTSGAPMRASAASSALHAGVRRRALTAMDWAARHPEAMVNLKAGALIDPDRDESRREFVNGTERVYPDGRVEFVWTLRDRTMKYPLIRVVEEAPGTDTMVTDDQGPAREMVADHFLVTFDGGAPPDVEGLRQAGFTVRRKLRLSETYLVAFDVGETDAFEARHNALLDLEGVTSANADGVVSIGATPNDPELSKLWGMHNTGQQQPPQKGKDYGTPDADIDAPEAWEKATGNRSVIVAVIDTGVAYNHEDLAANCWKNMGEIAGNGVDDDGNGFIDDVHGWDFFNDDGDPMDDHSHGTHCAGTIGAVGNNGIGVVGVCWQTQIMALKFLSDRGQGYDSDAIDAIDYACMMRGRGHAVRVLSNSWAGRPGAAANAALKAAIERANAEEILFVAAAGNDNNDNDVLPMYPSSYEVPNVIAVANSDRNDLLYQEIHYGRVYNGSSYGSNSVDLVAPGTEIFSTVPGDYYTWFSGTSMACPHVAGAATLMLSVNPSLNAAEVKARLLDGVDTLPTLVGKVATGGRLNVNNALPDAPMEAYPFLDAVALRELVSGDEILNPGEAIAVRPTLFNIGKTALTDVKVVVSSSDSNIAISDATSGVGLLPGGDRREAADDIVFTVDAGVSTPYVVNLAATITSGDGRSWPTTINVHLYASSYVTVRVLDAMDSSGIPDAVVTYSGWAAAGKGATDANGTFVLGPVKDGAYTFTAELPGAYDVSSPVTCNVPPNTELAITLDSPRLELDRESLSFTVRQGETTTGTLRLSNVRSLSLHWDAITDDGTAYTKLREFPVPSGVRILEQGHGLTGGLCPGDGATIWYSPWDTFLFGKLHRDSGALLEKVDMRGAYAAQYPNAERHGMAWDTDRKLLWVVHRKKDVLNRFTGRMTAFDPVTKQIVKVYTASGAVLPPTGVAYADGKLILSATYKSSPDTYVGAWVHVDPDTLQVVDIVPFAEGYYNGLQCPTAWRGSLWGHCVSGGIPTRAPAFYRNSMRGGEDLSYVFYSVGSNGARQPAWDCTIDDRGRIYEAVDYGKKIIVTSSGVVPWMSVDTWGGDLAGGDALDLQVLIDARAAYATVGTHQAKLMFVCNDQGLEPLSTGALRTWKGVKVLPVTLTVVPPQDQPPVITAGPSADPAEVDVPGSVTLAAQAEDPEGGAVTYEWGVVEMPGEVVVETPNMAQTRVQLHAVGIYTFELRVRDSVGNLTTARVDVEGTSENVAREIRVSPDSLDVTLAPGTTKSVALHIINDGWDIEGMGWENANESVGGYRDTQNIGPVDKVRSLMFDGKYIYMICNELIKRIDYLAPEPWKTRDSKYVPKLLSNPFRYPLDGAYDGELFWLAAMDGVLRGFTLTWDPTDPLDQYRGVDVQRSFSLANGEGPAGVACGDGRMFVVTFENNIHELNPQTGAILKTYAVPAEVLAHPIPFWTEGFLTLTWLNGDLLISVSVYQQGTHVYRMNPENGAVRGHVMVSNRGTNRLYSGAIAAIGRDAIWMPENLAGNYESFLHVVAMRDLPWLQRAPERGRVDPKSSVAQQITFDATGLTGGVYRTSMQIRSNAETMPILDVPVTMRVGSTPPPPNESPTADASPDQTVTDADNSGSEAITLDGSGSSDSDGSIASYVWTEGGTQIATGVSPTVDLTVGTHTITLTVTDDDGATDSDTVVITVNAGGSGGEELVMHLALDESGGTTAADSSGAGNDGALKNGAVFVPGGGLNAGAVAFDGTDDRIEVADSADINLRTVEQRTIALWFRADNVSGGKQVLYKEGGGARGLAVYLDGGKLYVGAWPNCSYVQTAAPGDGQWHHAALVLDAGAGTLRGYLDGAEYGSGPAVAVSSHGGDISLGGNDGSFVAHDGEVTSGAFAGRLDDARIYNRVLNGTEIEELSGGGTPPDGPRLYQAVLQNVGSEWQTVMLPTNYSSMVVVATPQYGAGELPAVTRVRNAAGSSFELKVQNPSDAALSGYTVHVLVVEEGVFTEAQHGIRMEAVKYTSTVTDYKFANRGEARSYQQSYTSPVVLGQVMSANDASWSIFWACGPKRDAPPSATALKTGKNVGEDPDRTRENETIGYVVIESGLYNLEDLDVLAGVGGDIVQGYDDAPPYSYALSGLSGADTAVLSAAGLDGEDGVLPLLYGSDALSATELLLALDEDQVNDSERNHTTEQMAFVVFDDSGTAPNQPPTANAQSVTVAEDGSLAIVLTGSDPDGDALRYAVVSGPAHGVLGRTDQSDPTDQSDLTDLIYTPAANYTGADSFTFKVNDGQVDSAVATVSITVTPVNDAPTANAGADRTVTDTDNDGVESVVLDGSGSSDPDGDALSYEWSELGEPIATGAKPTVNFDVGTHTLTLTVTDPAGLSDTDTVVVTVQAAPVDRVTVTVAGTAGSYDVLSYGGNQDKNPAVSILDGGATLQLVGNGWKKVDLGSYTVTEKTVIEFDYSSSAMGEIQGIGLDTDDGLSAGWTFKLYGSQNWGLGAYNDYAATAPAVKHYVIRVGEHFAGTFRYLTFVNDHDVSNPTAEGVFSNIRVYEQAEGINFNDYTIESYGGNQDKGGTVAIEDSGATLRLVGNMWKKIALPYTITAKTVLEFDFASSAQGEIHGIGFDADDGISADRTFKLYGTQGWGIRNYADYGEYAPEWRHYTIPVGEHYTGEMLYLTFTMDHDVSNPTGESLFRNVRVYESDPTDPTDPSDPVPGLDYAYYEGTWSALPDFDALTPATEGNTANVDISVRLRNDSFGFAFTGYLDIPADGDYTFYTSSDDGSKLYIGGTLVVNNDGLHSKRERSGTITLTAGKHPIRVTFFEKGGGQVLEVRWQGPGISKQLVPDSVLFRDE